MEAVNRTDPISVKYCTQGGKNLVMYCQAGLYELLRKAAIAYYANFKSHQFEGKTTCLREKGSGLLVQSTHRIRNGGGGYTSYTINLYHTRTTTLVNGKGTDNFIDTDLPSIMAIIQDCASTNPQILNEHLKTCLQKMSQAIRHEKTSNQSSSMQTQWRFDLSHRPGQRTEPAEMCRRHESVSKSWWHGQFDWVRDGRRYTPRCSAI